MKKIVLLLFCLCTLVMPLNALAAGGGTYIGDDNAETLFTGSATSHYLILSSNGVVSSWGKNTYGQCGAEPCDEITEVNYIDFESKVVEVVAGNDFSLALDENNTVWGWGNNAKFQLGISIPADIMSDAPTYFTKPKKIAENIIDIAAGDDFSILLNEEGEVLFSGMSISRTLKELDFPEIDGQIPKIKAINANYNNIVAIGENNYVFYGKADRQFVEVIELPMVDEVESAVVGKKHLIIRCLNGDYIEFYGYGDNSKNQLGVLNVFETTEPVLSLSIPKEQNQYISEFAGAYNTVVNVWSNISSDDNVLEYRWGTTLTYQGDNSDITMVDQITIYTPEEDMVYYQMIAMGTDKNIGFGFMTNDIMVFDYSQSPHVIPIIEPCDEINTMYEYQYNNIDYHTYNVNFIKLNENTFSNENAEGKYLHWEFINENQFRVKIKNFIKGMGQSGFNPAISTIMLGKETTGENRTVGTYGPSVWNFNIKNELFKTDIFEVNHRNENGTELLVSAFEVNRMEEKPLSIPSDVNVFYENPGEITENTKLGLYLYGLPSGITGMISHISDNTFKITLSGNSKSDLDYDSELKLCYIRAVGSQDEGSVVGDFNLDEVSVIAGEQTLEGFTIKAIENTPEILVVSGLLTKGKENGKIINVSITGGIFAENLESELWKVTGISGVSIDSVEKIDDNNVKITLLGSSSDKYTNGELRVICDPSQYSDSRIYEADTGKYKAVELSSENYITVTKQSKGLSTSLSTYVTNPTSNVKSGEVIKGTLVELSSTLTNAKIYYTTDGSQPTIDKNLLYKSPIEISESVTIKFIAASGSNKSAVQTVTYTVKNADKSKDQIIFTIGETKAIVFEEEKQNDVAPIIKDDRAFLPARFVAENLGASVEWDESEPGIVTISKDEIKIIIYIGAEEAIVNGKRIKLDTPAFIENNRTYTPIRFVAENLGAEVEWIEESQSVIVGKL